MTKKPKKQKQKKKGKEILPHATRWMNLEDTILGEISQSVNGKYFMIPLM